MVTFLLIAAVSTAGATGDCGASAERLAASKAAVVKQLHVAEALPGTLDNRLEVARLLYFQAKYTGEKKDREELLRRAMEIIEMARAEAPKSPGALLGFAAARGELARTAGIFKALRYVKEVRDALNALKEVDAAYGGFAADRGLGILYHEAPSLFSIGSKEKSKLALDAAMAGDPTNPGNRLAYGQQLLREKQRAEARAAAAAVLVAVAQPRWVIEAGEWAQQACELAKAAEE